jgi:putative transposase
VIRFGVGRFAEGRMPAAVAITRTEHTPSDLRRAAARTRDARAARRMLAIALVLEGHPRAEAALACGMERQTLRDWIHRYDAEGLAGLSNRSPPRPAPRLAPAQEAEVAAWVRRGPDPARLGGLVRWRRRDLRDEIAARFGVALAERTVGDLLRELNFSRVSVRPHHPQKDAAAQEAFKKTSPPL